MNIHQFFYELFNFWSILSNHILKGSEIDQFPAILNTQNWNCHKILEVIQIALWIVFLYVTCIINEGRWHFDAFKWKFATAKLSHTNGSHRSFVKDNLAHIEDNLAHIYGAHYSTVGWTLEYIDG